MKNISLSKLIVTVMGISAAQLCAYEFKLHNHLNVPIRVMLPLVAELKSPEIIDVPAKGKTSYNPQGWYAGYCLNYQNVKVAKEGADFVNTPLKSVQGEYYYEMVNNYTSVMRAGNVEAIRDNVLFINTFGFCKDIEIDIIETTRGELFAIEKPLWALEELRKRRG